MVADGPRQVALHCRMLVGVRRHQARNTFDELVTSIVPLQELLDGHRLIPADRSHASPCEAMVHHVTGRGSLPGRWYAEGGSVSQAPSFVSWLLLTVASLPEEGLSEELIDRAQSGL